MSEMGNALRASSDALLRDLTELQALEQEKRHTEPDSPRLVRLAIEIEALAARVMGSSMRQRERAEEIVGAGGSSAPDDTIAETPREIHVILAEWRDTERALTDGVPGSAEADIAERRIDTLRREYHRAHDAARRRSEEGRGTS
ncbi:MAG: hypothetical protein WEF51_07515 [Chloroflexota bacterium]